MRKVLLLFLLMLAIGLGYGAAKILPSGKAVVLKPKQAVLKVALVTDSHNDNDLLAKALAQAKAEHVDFVIGMGDFTNTGTVAELEAAKSVFNTAGLTYYVTAGDHDLWDSRDKELKVGVGEASKSALDNFRAVFGESQQTFTQKEIQFVILDNSDIYKGMDENEWSLITSLPKREVDPRRVDIEDRPLVFVMAHKTPYHPQSAHIMGEETPAVATQANRLIKLIEQRKVDGFFSGDLHFFANFLSPNGSVKMTTIGAVTREPNPQGPRFGVLTVFDDYTWEVADIEIK